MRRRSIPLPYFRLKTSQTDDFSFVHVSAVFIKSDHSKCPKILILQKSFKSVRFSGSKHSSIDSSSTLQAPTEHIPSISISCEVFILNEQQQLCEQIFFAMARQMRVLLQIHTGYSPVIQRIFERLHFEVVEFSLMHTD